MDDFSDKDFGKGVVVIFIAMIFLMVFLVWLDVVFGPKPKVVLQLRGVMPNMVHVGQ